MEKIKKLKKSNEELLSQNIKLSYKHVLFIPQPPFSYFSFEILSSRRKHFSPSPSAVSDAKNLVLFPNVMLSQLAFHSTTHSIPYQLLISWGCQWQPSSSSNTWTRSLPPNNLAVDGRFKKVSHFGRLLGAFDELRQPTPSLWRDSLGCWTNTFVRMDVFRRTCYSLQLSGVQPVERMLWWWCRNSLFFFIFFVGFNFPTDRVSSNFHGVCMCVCANVSVCGLL